MVPHGRSGLTGPHTRMGIPVSISKHKISLDKTLCRFKFLFIFKLRIGCETQEKLDCRHCFAVDGHHKAKHGFRKIGGNYINMQTTVGNIKGFI